MSSVRARRRSRGFSAHAAAELASTLTLGLSARNNVASQPFAPAAGLPASDADNDADGALQCSTDAEHPVLQGLASNTGLLEDSRKRHIAWVDPAHEQPGTAGPVTTVGTAAAPSGSHRVVDINNEGQLTFASLLEQARADAELRQLGMAVSDRVAQASERLGLAALWDWGAPTEEVRSLVLQSQLHSAMPQNTRA